VEPWVQHPSTKEMKRLVERLINLMYLIRKKSNNSSKVELYVDLADETLSRMNALTRDPEDPPRRVN
jgi:hypothetical protein